MSGLGDFQTKINALVQTVVETAAGTVKISHALHLTMIDSKVCQALRPYDKHQTSIDCRTYACLKSMFGSLCYYAR